MTQVPIKTYAKAVGIGIVAGMRSMLAPALVSRHYAQTRPAELTNSPLAFMDSPRTATVFAVLAGGELIGDKLPSTPSRIEPAGLTGRIGSGGLCGAAIVRAEGQQGSMGAIAGGLGALIGTYGFYQVRHWLVQEKGLADVWVALAEDALAIGAGLWILDEQPVAETA